MTLAGCLLLYGLLVAVLAPRALMGVTGGGSAPRLGVAGWLVAIGSVLGAWLLAVGLLVADLAGWWVSPAVGSCLTLAGRVVAGQHGPWAMVVLAVLVALAVLGTVGLVLRLAVLLRRGRRRAARHEELAGIVGRRIPGLDAVVVDARQPAAYCVAGRPGTIVVTSGALDVLAADQLRAVLAHERAHLAGRHHVLLALTQGLAGVLPGVRLFTAGAVEVARLLEMAADDAAVRRHDPVTLVGALLVLAPRPTLPAAALGATGAAVGARAQRLLHPAGVVRAALARLVLSCAVAVLVIGPAAVVALAAVGIDPCRIPLG